MFNYRTMIIGLISIISLFSCKTYDTIYEGKFKGQNYSITSIETKGPSTNSFDYELKFGNLKSVMINALTTNLSVLYSKDVFKNTEYITLPVPQTPYMNEYNYDEKIESTVLYFPEDRFTKDEFKKYSELMISEWPNIDKKFIKPYTSFPRIIGIVYGNDKNFTLTFKSDYDGKPYLLVVQPDGFIKFYADDDKRNYEYSGLSDKVQMPDKIIFLKTGKEAKLAQKDILNFKDNNGKNLNDYFIIKEKE